MVIISSANYEALQLVVWLTLLCFPGPPSPPTSVFVQDIDRFAFSAATRIKFRLAEMKSSPYFCMQSELFSRSKYCAFLWMREGFVMCPFGCTSANMSVSI